MIIHNFFATAPKGLEPLLADELRALGAADVAETRAGVGFSGDLEMAYRVCLWSRLASRVLLPLATFSAPGPDALYEQVRALPWEEHFAGESTLAVNAQVNRSQISHSRFAALKVKDGIVDRFRERTGSRPSVDVRQPDLRINLYLFNDEATLSIDLSGESLHRRGYRAEGVMAPLKENLAAAILLRAGWPDIAAAGGSLLDPLCGSGTLPIEAALMAADIAPGLNRPAYGFFRWLGHRSGTWKRLVAEALERRKAGLDRLPDIAGYDSAGQAIRAARINADRAGLGGLVRFEQKELTALRPLPAMECRPGLLVANPPYGERLGEVAELRPLYAGLGESLRTGFVGWKAAVLTGNPDLAKQIAIRARRRHTLYNGALECRLFHFDIDPQWFFGADMAEGRPSTGSSKKGLSPGAAMFANRLRKNLRQVKRWADRGEITCFRLYDADMPEYAVAVDLYEQWLHVQEYQAPSSIDPDQARKRLDEVMEALPEALDMPPERIFLKVRSRQSGASQYNKLSAGGQLHEVREGDCRFLVNFTDYLDTGLFLDHRLTRRMIRELAAGKRFLNLFAYTGTATVHAARGGAATTTTVDMSRTYLDWAKRNLALNGFREGPRHRMIQADCLGWLERESSRPSELYDLIFLDPPTFSNSKGMEGTFDVQRDHVQLLRQTAKLLERGGILLFSNNFRKFKMERDALPELEIEDVTAATIPKDFARNPRIHHCWVIKHREG
ncbi:MAG: bifunctional 23S rRNA (guanine(2069)-N(7))-methyltransferase RlmK/23S rRNA (guanine(2445)-N(2))-methyltransferase RlmL [Syntrophotaleaceae bacterium]